MNTLWKMEKPLNAVGCPCDECVKVPLVCYVEDESNHGESLP